jgi:sulfite exporter TauE/SafE
MIWSALVLGFIGSLHCLGMCGPLVLSLPSYGSSISSAITRSIIYNGARIITYTSFGLISGVLIKSFSLFGLQQYLSIFSGIVLLIMALSHFNILSKVSIVSSGFILSVKQAFTNRIKKAGLLNLFTLGLLNGLLPCGLVYMALAASATQASSSDAMLYMLLFGLGTTPAIFSIMMSNHFFKKPFFSFTKKFYPYFLIAIAGILILRGMNLGIPYVSPKMQAETCVVDCCHKK